MSALIRLTGAIEHAYRDGAAAERRRIADRVRQMKVLRLQAGADPLDEINHTIQMLADDIEANWADFDDDEAL